MIRSLLFVATILILATSIFSSVFFENHYLISKWNIPMCPPSFLDSRQFAWASESSAMGYDPLVENPANPRGQQLNYPRIWQLLFALGINESHTNILGTVVVLIFFVGIALFWFSRKFDNLTYVFLFIVFLSPAVMLGIERSNIELVLFFILSLAVLVNYYSRISAFIIFILASILKLYPVFGFVYLLKENKRRFWMLFLLASGIFILYGIVSFEDFIHVYRTTPKSVGSSFGLNVWWMGLRHPRFFNLSMSDSLILYLKVHSYAMACLILVVSLIMSLRIKNNRLSSESKYIDAFRVGTGIYIGCFLTMNTHDYRLIFLFFAIPQLVAWMRDRGKDVAFVSIITLAAMIFSLWSFFIMRFLRLKLTFLMEELSNWIILAGLLYLFLSSLPEWFRDYFRQSFSSIIQIDETAVD